MVGYPVTFDVALLEPGHGTGKTLAQLLDLMLLAVFAIRSDRHQNKIGTH